MQRVFKYSMHVRIRMTGKISSVGRAKTDGDPKYAAAYSCRDADCTLDTEGRFRHRTCDDWLLERLAIHIKSKGSCARQSGGSRHFRFA